MELEGLRYSQLQRLAKQHGLKANMKADKLLKNLQEYFKQEQKTDAILKEPSPHLEKYEKTGSSDSNRRPRKRRAEFEHVTETGAESTGSVADGSATVTQCTRCSPERATNTAKGTAARSKAGKIPRFVGSVGKPGFKSPIGKSALTHVTPDWKKIHQANFNKMESIDLYVERKRKRIESVGNSIKRKSANESKTMKSALPFISPVHQASKINQLSTPANRRKSPRCSAAAVTMNEKSVLPFVSSVTKMNVRFTDTAKSNDRHSAMKTPIRKSAYTELPSNSGTEVKKVKPAGSEKQTDINTGNPDQTKVVTPYRFSGSTTPGTNKKFDLKASLSRPLSYKPHKGKLKSWEEMKENRMAHSHKKDPKQPKLQTRASRREVFLEERKVRKNDVISARRGLVME
ncbi:nucleolar and spindle-associated protein 1 isoform X2 [Mustelus asterias]